MQRLRRLSDHQIGFLVEVEGEKRVRLDRGTHKQADTSTIPYRPEQWEVAPKREFTSLQIARTCYDADRAYRLQCGNYGVPEWKALREEAQRAWMNPPADDPVRTRLYEAITAVMRDA